MTKGAKQHDNQVESLRRMKKTIKISKITKNNCKSSQMTKIIEKNFKNIAKDLGD
jgi:predicted nuclease of predicted toxin-antitoxin system